MTFLPAQFLDMRFQIESNIFSSDKSFGHMSFHKAITFFLLISIGEKVRPQIQYVFYDNTFIIILSAVYAVIRALKKLLAFTKQTRVN